MWTQNWCHHAIVSSPPLTSPCQDGALLYTRTLCFRRINLGPTSEFHLLPLDYVICKIFSDFPLLAYVVYKSFFFHLILLKWACISVDLIVIYLDQVRTGSCETLVLFQFASSHSLLEIHNFNKAKETFLSEEQDFASCLFSLPS